MAGYLRQRSPGSWFLQWSLGKKDGKYQKASKTFYGKKKDAQAELDRIIQEVRSGNYVSPTKTTVADFLRKWLEIYAEKQVAGSTFERYKGIVEQHLIPALGNIPLQQLQPAQVQEYYAKAQESGRVKRISRSAARIAKAQLRQKALEAERGSGPACKIFESIGVNIKDENGKLRSITDLISDVLMSLEQTEDIKQRNSLAIQLFGGDCIIGGGLSARSVQQHHAVLRKALQCGVRWQILNRNVADMVDSPRGSSQERAAFTEEEVKALLKSTDGTPYGSLVLIAASTGMRLGEALALTWDDLNTETAAISVAKSLQQTKEGLSLKEPKSARGKRLIPLPLNVVNRLMAYREQQEALCETAGELWKSNNLICCDELGRYRKPDSVSSVFRDITKKAKVRQLGFHSLRHAHATILANRGYQAKVIQERLGHSTIAVTMDIYSHVLPTTQQSAADAISDLF